MMTTRNWCCLDFSVAQVAAGRQDRVTTSPTLTGLAVSEYPSSHCAYSLATCESSLTRAAGGRDTAPRRRCRRRDGRLRSTRRSRPRSPLPLPSAHASKFSKEMQMMSVETVERERKERRMRRNEPYPTLGV